MEKLLCSREKRVSVFWLPGGNKLHVAAQMKDSVHHLRIDMVVNQRSLRICSIQCDIQSVPDEVCRQASDFFDDFIGRRVKPGLMSELRQKAGKGCTHLTDLFHDACYNLTMAQSVIGKEELTARFPDLTEEQLYSLFLLFRPTLGNSCVRYAEASPFMEKVRIASLPEEARKLAALPRD